MKNLIDIAFISLTVILATYLTIVAALVLDGLQIIVLGHPGVF